MKSSCSRYVLAVLFLILVTASIGHADPFRLRLVDVGSGLGVVITDNHAGDSNPLAGAITYFGSIGGFLLNVTTGISQPIIGGVNNYAELDLNSVNVQVGGAGTIQIMLEDSGYTSPDELNLAQGSVGGVLIAPAGSTATFKHWVNTDDSVPDFGADASAPILLPALGALPAGTIAIFDGTGFEYGPGAYSGSYKELFENSGPFSLFSSATINFTGAGTVSFDSNTSVNPVPEPVSLLLFGSGLMGLGVLRRRIKTQQV
jgi:hypothetical protein